MRGCARANVCDIERLRCKCGRLRASGRFNVCAGWDLPYTPRVPSVRPLGSLTGRPAFALDLSAPPPSLREGVISSIPRKRDGMNVASLPPFARHFHAPVSGEQASGHGRTAAKQQNGAKRESERHSCRPEDSRTEDEGNKVKLILPRLPTRPREPLPPSALHQPKSHAPVVSTHAPPSLIGGMTHPP